MKNKKEQRIESNSAHMQTKTTKRSKPKSERTEGALQERAELFRQIFDRSPFGIGIATLDGRVIASNRTMQNITGYTAAELSKINLSDTYEKKEDRKVLFEVLKRNDYAVDFPVRLKRKNGTPYDALLNVSKIMLGDKEYVQTICQDITERKLKGKALQASENHLSLIYDTVGDVLFLLAVEPHDRFRFESVNRNFLSVTGLKREQVEGKLMQEVLPPSAHALVLGKYKQAIQENRTVRWEEVSAYPTGKLYGEVAVTPAWNSAGVCTHLIGSVHDITEIRRSQEEIRALSRFPDENPNPVMRVSGEGKIIDTNQASDCILQMWGKKAGQVLPKPIKDLVLNSLLSKENQEIEITCGEKVFSFILAPIIEENYLNLYGTDITERLQADKVLAESENKFRWLYEYAPIAYHILTPDGIIMDVNRRWCQELEYSREEVLGKEIFDFIVKEERKAARASFIKKKAEKGAFIEGSERNYLTKAGVVRTFKTYDFLTMDQSQNITSVQTTLEDITERKRMEQKLRENEQKLEEAQKLGNIGNWEFDLESQTINWSDQVYRLYERDPALGPPSGKEEAAYYSSEQAKILREYTQQAAQHGRTIEYELTAQLPSGRPAIFAAKMQPVKNKDGQVVKLFGTVQDITERKHAQEETTKNEVRYRELFDNSPTPIWEQDYSEVYKYFHNLEKHGVKNFEQYLTKNPDELFKCSGLIKVLNVNDEAVRLFKAKSKDDLKVSIGNVFTAETLPVFKKSLLAIASQKKAFQSEVILQTLENEKIIALLKWSIIGDRVITSTQDITERKRAEETLQESEKRYRGLFEDSPISLWEEDFSAVKQRLDALREQGVTDIRAYLESHPQEVANCAALVRVLDVNKASMVLFRAKNKKHLIKNLAQTVGVEFTGKFIDELVNIGKGLTRFNYDALNQTIDGESIEVSLSWAAASGYEKDLSKVLVSIVDITQRKQAEAEMNRLIDELRALSEVEKKNRVFAEALAKNVIALNSTLKTDDILDSIIDNINNVVPSDSISIMLIQGNYAKIIRAKGYQERGLTDWVKQRQFDLNEIKTFREIIRSKKYKVTSNTDESKDWIAIAETTWIKSNIISPILDDKTVIGFVNVDSTTPDYYTEEHAQQLMAFTDQVSNTLKNARLFEDTQRRINRMQAMTQIDQAINSSLDLNVSLEIVLIQAKEQLNADAVDILLVNNVTNSLIFSKAKGFRTDEIRKSNFRLGTGLPARAVLERTTVAIPDLNSVDQSLFKNLLVEREGFFSYYCAPLITKGELKGVIEVYFRHAFQANQEWQEFLEMLAQQTAIAINNAELLNSLQISNVELLNAYETTLKGWVDALDMRDHETEGHTLRVADQSLQLARRIGIKDSEIVNFQRGALLHDIGKVAISDTILNKPGPLTEEEWVIMRQHPLTAFQLLSKSKYLIPALDIPYCHHEKWDGSGYPRGLKGEQIPLAARIFAIVDVWDALTSDRPYRKAWTQKKALEYIQEQSGIHFDPKVVAAFQTMNHAGRK